MEAEQHILLRKLDKIRNDISDYNVISLTRNNDNYIIEIVEKDSNSGKIKTTTITRDSNNYITEISEVLL